MFYLFNHINLKKLFYSVLACLHLQHRANEVLIVTKTFRVKIILGGWHYNTMVKWLFSSPPWHMAVLVQVQPFQFKSASVFYTMEGHRRWLMSCFQLLSVKGYSSCLWRPFMLEQEMEALALFIFPIYPKHNKYLIIYLAWLEYHILCNW